MAGQFVDRLTSNVCPVGPAGFDEGGMLSGVAVPLVATDRLRLGVEPVPRTGDVKVVAHVPSSSGAIFEWPTPYSCAGAAGRAGRCRRPSAASRGARAGTVRRACAAP